MIAHSRTDSPTCRPKQQYLVRGVLPAYLTTVPSPLLHCFSYFIAIFFWYPLTNQTCGTLNQATNVSKMPRTGATKLTDKQKVILILSSPFLFFAIFSCNNVHISAMFCMPLTSRTGQDRVRSSTLMAASVSHSLSLFSPLPFSLHSFHFSLSCPLSTLPLVCISSPSLICGKTSVCQSSTCSLAVEHP